MIVRLARHLITGLSLVTALALAWLGGAILAMEFDAAPNDSPYWIYGTAFIAVATGIGAAIAWGAAWRTPHQRALTLLGALAPLSLALLRLFLGLLPPR